MSNFLVKVGDCRDVLRQLPDDSIDSVVTDAPYELAFMGKAWDATGIAFNVAVWDECLRVLKPGGHLVAFGGTRTYHRMTCAIEDAGFEIRDCLMWLYGTGFPKSHNVAAFIDKRKGLLKHRGKRLVNGFKPTCGEIGSTPKPGMAYCTPVSPLAKEYVGWGTALKPAYEPIILARKPLDGTIADNVERWGTGALHIDACRIDYRDDRDKAVAHPGRCTSKKHGIAAVPDAGSDSERVEFAYQQKGRWPAHVMLDEVAADGLDRQTGIEASRFFYVVKPSRAEREAGCDGLPNVRRTDGRSDEHHVPNLRTTQRRNFHPCVKPISLMRYLCRLVTPPNGVVLDPFAGSGTTGCAATLEKFRFLGIEQNAEYAQIAKTRISYWASLPTEAAA